MKRRFRQWLRGEIVAAIEPGMAQSGTEMQRALEDATAAIRHAVRHEAAAVHAEMTELRRDSEQARMDLAATLERIGDELEASHATVRSLLARLRALEAAKPSRPARTQVVGGTIDAATPELESTEVDLTAMEVGAPVDASPERG